MLTNGNVDSVLAANLHQSNQMRVGVYLCLGPCQIFITYNMFVQVATALHACNKDDIGGRWVSRVWWW